MDVLKQFPVRFHKKQKAAFREAVCEYARSQGYTVNVEEGSLGSRNVVIGDPEKAKHVISAHYDTCARMLIPNFITPFNIGIFILYALAITAMVMIPAVGGSIAVAVLTRSYLAWCVSFYGITCLLLFLVAFGPPNKNNSNDNTSGVVAVLELLNRVPEADREKICFVLFDLEEMGLIGSESYRRAHKTATNWQVLWNLDCIGDGDDVVLIPSKKLKKDENKMKLLRKCANCYGEKSITVYEKAGAFYPSDQLNFPFGVGIAALKKSRFGLYLGRIHTKYDTILEETNINILCSAILSAIADSAEQ